MSEVNVRLSYGDSDLVCAVPADRSVVVQPTFVPPSSDPQRLIAEALVDPIESPNLRELARPGQTVAISVCDITRPQPRQLMVESVLRELDGVVSPDNVTVLVATGTHRENTTAELESMLGERVVSACRVVNHNARDESALQDMGVMGDGVPVTLNKAWVEADLRVTTGFVEPHFFAGFSGGPKMVAPGLAGLETILTLHDARRIGHPNATWGICEGNPVHDDVRAIAAETGVDFSLDVLLNSKKEITHAFAGSVLSMHEVAREECRSLSMQQVDQLFDVVVTTNSGYPLDQNLYQSIKGISAAMTVVKPGGVIVIATECRDGVPSHGAYGRFLESAESMSELKERIATTSHTVPDQWQVQIQARAQERARVFVHTTGLTDDQIRAAHLEPCHDISALVEAELKAAGSTSRVCVLPDGPQTIPYLASSI